MAQLVRCLDLLKERYPDKTSETLYASIMCGEVLIGGHTLKDPHALVDRDSSVCWKPAGFVSRGGLKLEYALTEWGIDVSGRGFLDAGASAGGFTDCLLSRGVAFVHAVDVGYNQLDWRLRSDKRVFVREKTNIMNLDSLEPIPHAAVADLSFRSLRRAVSRILSLTLEGWCIALIKPQFEYTTADRAFDGVIRDRERLCAVVQSLLSDLRQEEVYPGKILRSPIPGRKGNIEFLALFGRTEKLTREDIGSTLGQLLEEGKESRVTGSAMDIPSGPR